jgi:NitT/TauT family transport system substrate-binding protein
MARLLAALVALIGLAFLAAPGAAQRQSISVSYQPGAYNAMPLLAATRARVWDGLGLAVTLASFPSANAQLGAAALDTWDVGITNAVPAMVGAARHRLMIIGLTDDEAPGLLLLVRPGAERSQLRGLRLAAMGNSAAWLTLVACLERSGVRPADAQPMSATPAALLQQFRERRIDGLVLGFPATVPLLDRAEVQPTCSGRDAGLVIPGAIVARAALARDQPALLARFLAGYLRGAMALNSSQPATLAAVQDAFGEAGEPVSSDAVRAQLALRPYFTLAEQLQAMRFTGPRSQATDWFTRLSEALRLTTGLEALPAPLAYLTDHPLRALEADAGLIRFLDGR